MNISQWSIINFHYFNNLLKSKLLYILLTIFSSLFTYAASPVYFKTIDKKPTGLFVNPTNDIFILSKGMLERYSSEGVFIQNYGSIFINEHTEVISVNSFKTILFSPDYGKIIQLDNRLRELDIIDAFNLGTYIITCVGISYENNFIWLWDASTQRLIKLDKDQQPVFISNTMSLWIGKTIQPKQILEAGIYLYILDEEKGIFVFDNQGTYMKNIPIAGIQTMEIIEGQIIYYKDNFIYSYNPMTFSEIKYAETPQLEKIQIGKTIICGINKDGFVELWKF